MVHLSQPGIFVSDMPSKKAKDRKRKRIALNKKWSIEGRTAIQHKKWLAKEKANSPLSPVYGKK